MKNFQFENISMLSHRDKRARKEEFHPGRNLLIGRNHTGKSSLIKSLFQTLGARPLGKLEKWDENTITRVSIKVGAFGYSVIHQLGNRALFDDNGEILASTGDHYIWSQKFAGITGFNLTLANKKLETVPAGPECFFLPFYINQDGSWQSKWDTFSAIQQFSKPVSAILEYFTGIKPPEYYSIQAKRYPLSAHLDELRREKKILERAKDRVSDKLNLNGPKLVGENFEAEVESLTNEVTLLNSSQELLREKLVKQRELVDNIAQQISLANEALKVYNLDFKFIQKQENDLISCPTCGAEHNESFIDYLSYSEDARVLRELVIMLQQDQDKTKRDYEKTRGELNELNDNYRRISRILDTRKGDLLFKDVVDSAGSEKAFQVFQEEQKSINEEMAELQGSIDELDVHLAELVSKERSARILSDYRNSYASSRRLLNLPPVETKKLQLTSRPNLSGSGGPRSILAYYAAIWKTCFASNGTFNIPIVIDSPNQQAQDDINMPKVLSFIANNLPNGVQIIVGSEEDTNLDFDKKFIFTKPYELLEKEQFDEVESQLEPYLNKMYQNLGK